MIQKLKNAFLSLNLIAGLFFALTPALASAATTAPGPCAAGYAHPLDSSGNPLSGCAKIITSQEAKTVCGSGLVNSQDPTKCQPLGNSCPLTTGVCPSNPIVRDLNNIVNVLSGLVGVVVVGTIILGGIQYAAAGDKADAVSAAKKRIINGVLALVVFLFIFAFLQWLIPGGIFS